LKLTDIDLNKLHTFLAVAELGGVGKAAQQLGRTSSAISQSISTLEAALGRPLFDRVGKRLVPTRGGQLLRARLAACRELLERGVAEIRDETAKATGTVRLGAYIGFPCQRLAALLMEFTRLHPEASVRVSHAPGRELERRLRNNQLDFVLSFASPAPVSHPLAFTRLFSQELVLVSSRRYFQSGAFDLEALARTPIVDYYEKDPLIRRWLSHYYPRRNASFVVRFWAATTDLVLELLSAGAGAGVLPRHVAVEGLASGELLEIGPDQKRALLDPIWLVEPRGAHRDATLVAFRTVAQRAAATDERDQPGGAAPRSPSSKRDRGDPNLDRTSRRAANVLLRRR
jgi:DNA-binding transcriptional LysR family regulator